ncbi:phasin family protein [Aureimonas psammosilenae]|uniref:phasin family protein n=1 Tax=Aureimonas psammosilenae TaxID=2495496 RepID=UPI00186A296C|nr:phasin family protein [Aureimonas psammosilenae]
MSNFDEASNVGKEAVDGAVRSLSVVTRGFQQIASETTEYTKRSYEQSARMFEQLSQLRSFDKVVEVQNEFAKNAYQDWISQATKVGEIYGSMAREVYKPFEQSFTNAINAGQSAVKQAL